MTVSSIEKDAKATTVTITAAFDAPIERVWQLVANPRQLERWWGLPTHPATVIDHDLTPGGRVTYFLTGPEGDQSRGWWRVLDVEAPHSLEFEDGFGDDTVNPDPMMTIRISLNEQSDGGTGMALATTFPSPETMEMIIAMMGGEESMSLSVGQIDELLQVEITPT
jgi:uncharacterized protein YndB with AHSA1/START domain